MDGNNSLFCLFAAPDSQFLRFCLGIDRNILDPAGESSIGDEKSGGVIVVSGDKSGGELRCC